MSPTPFSQRGFTLIELLVVIAIIGTLASVVLASLNSAREKSRNAAYVSQVKEYQKAFELYHANNGSYPGTTAFTCLGDYSDNACWHASSAHTESSTFNTQLSAHMGALPVPGAPHGHSREGALYRLEGSGYRILYALEGDVDCPFGTAQSESYEDVTMCDYTY